jgi:thiamine pyrophosphokinase
MEGVLRAVIIANGELGEDRVEAHRVHESDLIIAADGGLRNCLALGITPNLLVGDLDSLDPAEVQAIRSAGVHVIRHPAEKDQTDLELALDYAQKQGATRVGVLAALGQRWDQTLANLLLPLREGLESVEVTLLQGDQSLRVLRAGSRLSLEGAPGDTVSLIPLGGDATGITTHGLEYPLEAGTLRHGSTRGISNSMVGGQAQISLQAGLLVCVHIRHASQTP